MRPDGQGASAGGVLGGLFGAAMVAGAAIWMSNTALERVSEDRTQENQARVAQFSSPSQTTHAPENARSSRDWLRTALALYVAIVIVMSVISFVFYGCDKWFAENGRQRVSEATLLQLAFLGGWPGAEIAQWIFYHKIKKESFRTAFWQLVVLHNVIVIIVTIAISWFPDYWAGILGFK